MDYILLIYGLIRKKASQKRRGLSAKPLEAAISPNEMK